MTDPKDVAAHYTKGGLLDRITTVLAGMGVVEPLDINMLAAVDEFHIGGRRATKQLLQHLQLTAGSRVLDLGCGLGGAARFVAKSTGAQVSGIDLTDEFITTGQALTRMTGQVGQVDLVQGSILELPFGDDHFDAAYMIHVGMNITDKRRLMAQAARVLKPGGLLAVYDVMRVGSGDLILPVPWASTAEGSALASPASYRMAMTEAGFRVVSEVDRTAFAKVAFAAQAGAARTPLGLHLVMGADTKTKVANMVSNVLAGRIAPVEMIGQLA